MYALFSEWPYGSPNQVLSLARVNATKDFSNFTLLDGGSGLSLPFTADGDVVNVLLPAVPPNGTSIAWAVKMDNIQPI